jgi:hypothetical protein
MLRFWVLLLLLANVLFFAWTQGAMDHVLGLRSIGDREPERLASQVRPDDLTVLSSQAASAPRAAARMECFEAGPYAPAQVPAVEQAASAAAPALAWTRRQSELPGRWAVVMGPYPSREAMDKKIEELKRTRVAFEEMSDSPAFRLALSLGRHESAQAANAALAVLGNRGIKTARVAVLTPPSTQVFLRAETDDAAQLAQLRSLKGEPWGAGLAACP